MGARATTGEPVLVVEDDGALREALTDTLALAGIPALSADDGEAALQVLERQPVRLIVSDVQMDPMDGHELLQRVKARQPSLPVILMTGFGTTDTVMRAMNLGAFDYVIKPLGDELASWYHDEL